MLPVRYLVFTDKGKYKFSSYYDQYDMIVKRNEKKGIKVKMIASWCNSTNKSFGDQMY